MDTEGYLEALRSAGVSTSTAAPLAFRLAWRLGVVVSPPVYWSALAVLLFQGLPTGVLAALGVLGIDTYIRGSVLPAWWYATIGVGIAALLTMSLSFQYGRLRRRRLPDWQDYITRA